MNIEQLYQVFAPAENRDAEQPLLADYDRMLGEDFVQCRKDLRPCLPAWANDIAAPTKEASETGLTSDDDDNGDEANDVAMENQASTRPSEEQVLALSNHLSPAAALDLKTLDTWLFNQLSSSSIPDEVVHAWC